jgi:hypothetical protein
MTTPTLKEAREAMIDALRACIRAASPEQQAELLKVLSLYRSAKAIDAALRAAPGRGHMTSEISEGRGIQGKGQPKTMNQ